MNQKKWTESNGMPRAVPYAQGNAKGTAQGNAKAKVKAQAKGPSCAMLKAHLKATKGHGIKAKLRANCQQALSNPRGTFVSRSANSCFN